MAGKNTDDSDAGHFEPASGRDRFASLKRQMNASTGQVSVFGRARKDSSEPDSHGSRRPAPAAPDFSRRPKATKPALRRIVLDEGDTE